MADRPINLTRARKDRARTERRAQGDANAAKFGRTKAERAAQTQAEARAAANLDGHLREPADRSGKADGSGGANRSDDP